MRIARSLVFVAAGIFFFGASSLQAAEPPEAPRHQPQQGYAGIDVAPIDAADRPDYGLAPNQPGLVVLEVDAAGPAGKAGLKTGDILLTVNGQACETVEFLVKTIRGLAPGSDAKLDILRDEKPSTLVMKVGSISAPGAASAPEGSTDVDEADIEEMIKQEESMLGMLQPEMGAKMKEINQYLRKKKALAMKKPAALMKKYMAEGLSMEEASERLRETLNNDAEFQKLKEYLDKDPEYQKLQKELQEAMQGAARK